MHASYNGHTEVAKLLIKNEADINAKIDDRHTELMYALEERLSETAQSPSPLCPRYLSGASLNLQITH